MYILLYWSRFVNIFCLLSSKSYIWAYFANFYLHIIPTLVISNRYKRNFNLATFFLRTSELGFIQQFLYYFQSSWCTILNWLQWALNTRWDKHCVSEIEPYPSQEVLYHVMLWCRVIFTIQISSATLKPVVNACSNMARSTIPTYILTLCAILYSRFSCVKTAGTFTTSKFN